MSGLSCKALPVTGLRGEGAVLWQDCSGHPRLSAVVRNLLPRPWGKATTVRGCSTGRRRAGSMTATQGQGGEQGPRSAALGECEHGGL